MMCVFVLFIEQSQLPRGETALRVFAQQVGPHQAADSRFWPATGAGLELRAQHTKSTLISIESGVTNQVGGGSVCLDPPTPSVTASRSSLAPRPQLLSLPPLHAPASFLPPFLLFNSTGFVIACNHENPTWTLPPPSRPLFLILFFFAFISFFFLKLLWNFKPLD